MLKQLYRAALLASLALVATLAHAAVQALDVDFASLQASLGQQFAPSLSRSLGWTPGTTTLISIDPDPATYAMLVIGLVLVAVAARRQRRFLRG